LEVWAKQTTPKLKGQTPCCEKPQYTSDKPTAWSGNTNQNTAAKESEKSKIPRTRQGNGG